MGLFSRKKDVGELREAGDIGGLLEAAEKSRKDDERAAALEAIRSLGPEAAEPLAAEANRNAAATALGMLGEDVAMPVAQRLIAEGGESRLKGYKILASIDSPASADALAAGIRSATERADAITGTATNWKRCDRVVVDALFSVVEDAMDSPYEAAYDSAVSSAGARAVAGDDAGVEALLEKLRSEDWRMRLLAASALHVGYQRTGVDRPEDAEADTRTADALATACGDEHYDVRTQAAGALGLQGDRRATPVVVEMLGSSSEDDVRLALDVLKVLRDPAALDALDPLYQDANAHGLGMKTAALVGRRHGQLKEAAKAEQAAGAV